MAEIANQQLSFDRHESKDAPAHLNVGPVQLALCLAAYFFLVEANAQFALFLSILAILLFEWEHQSSKIS